MCLLSPGDLLLWDSRTVHCSYPGRCGDDNDDDNDEASSANDDDAVGAQQSEFDSSQGLIRAASLVSMMPSSRATGPAILARRKEAVDRCRTLTHWANEVAPLGEEREEEAAKEGMRVDFIKRWQWQQRRQSSSSGGDGDGDGERRRRKVLLSFSDLNREQRRLVCGDIE
mmetsp:Transcript_35861/g.107057  ORF Transcript_35861/g.107057 Transcript_35861/m.107057 type:complete len:170 (+) Transcript_35861:2210-2719(+)